MANFAWPDYALPRDFTLSQYTNVVRNIAIFGKKGQNIDLLNDRWIASVQIAARDSEVSPLLESFVNKLKAGANTVELYHFARPTISGELLSDLVSNYIAKGSDILYATVATGSTLKAGDMLGVNGMLMQVALDCEAISNLIEIPLTMRIRKTVNAGTPITTVQPTAKFRLNDLVSTTYGPNATIRGLELNLLEDIA